MRQASAMAVQRAVISRRVNAMVNCAVLKTVIMEKSTATSYVTVAALVMVMSTVLIAQPKRLSSSITSMSKLVLTMPLMKRLSVLKIKRSLVLARHAPALRLTLL